MAHCANCLLFYPNAMPQGCPFCDAHGFHKKPYCQFCGTQPTVLEYDKATHVPLRPNCPTCGRGPLIPSSIELKRRLSIDPAVEPFVPTAADVEILTEAGDTDLLKIDGDLLGIVRLRRTHGPVELVVQSEAIEGYFRDIYKHFPGPQTLMTKTPEGLPIFSSPHGAANPYNGMAYYPCAITGMNFYSADGRKGYAAKGFGQDMSVPGIGSIKGHAIDLSFLMAVGLGKGLTFKYNMVLDNGSILECLKGVKEGILGIYTNFMKPIEHTVVIAVRTESTGAKATLGAVPKLATKRAAEGEWPGPVRG